MRVLIVYQRYRDEAASAIANVGGIRLFSCGNEPAPVGRDLLAFLEDHRGIEVGFIGVSRRYRKAVREGYDVRDGFNAESVASQRGQLEAWLRPPEAAVQEEQVLSPSEAFRRASKEEPRLVLADEALSDADRIAEEYWPFANRAAAALQEYAHNPVVGQRFDLFFAERGLHGYAPKGGDVEIRYRVFGSDGSAIGQLHLTKQHLLDGPRGFTPRVEIKPRIYFRAQADAHGCTSVVVLKCGPHPRGEVPPLNVRLRHCEKAK